jgi:hypothetical protein
MNEALRMRLLIAWRVHDLQTRTAFKPKRTMRSINWR